MRTRLFFSIVICFFVVIILNSFTPCSLAMSKRPKAAKKSDSKRFVLPEIEIISQPEANRQLLLGDQTEPAPRVGVSPTEVLPAVGKDANLAAKGYMIVDVQRALHNAGFDIGSIDGKMGPKTKKAIQNFQKENNLTADGIVGKKTWAALKLYIGESKTSNGN
ncbi:MAG: peptidoglycan-binding domain-containing protein [Candidatus Omnitrophota bacterium]